jgi:hypothetical protein
MPDGRVDVKGRVVESDPPRKLVVTRNPLRFEIASRNRTRPKNSGTATAK